MIRRRFVMSRAPGIEQGPREARSAGREHAQRSGQEPGVRGCNNRRNVTLMLAILGAFLCGSIPFGLIIGRARGIDIRTHGSGNIGATNVGRVLGRKLGLACFALDVLKGLGPTLGFGLWAGYAGRFWLEPGESWRWLAVMCAPVLGHMFCPWVGFKGGKGVATGLGALLGVFPVLSIAGAGALIVWLAALRVWRMVSLASILAAASLPLWIAGSFVIVFARRDEPLGTQGLSVALPFLCLGVALAALVIVRHRSNMARIRSGTESKVSWLGQSTAPAAQRP